MEKEAGKQIAPYAAACLAAMTATFILAWLCRFPAMRIGLFAVTGGVSALIAVSDIRNLRVPLYFRMAFLLCAVWSVFVYDVPLWERGVMAGALLIVLFVLYCFMKTRILGGADIKLIVIAAFMLGTKAVWAVLIFAVVTFLSALVMRMCGDKGAMKKALPLAPFIMLGVMVVLFVVLKTL